MNNYFNLSKCDQLVFDLIQKEIRRQQEGLILIPSENIASYAVLEAASTVLTNKYSEGYPHHRYYTGNQYIDEIEQIAIDRAKLLFKAEHANVQPHSGSSANMAAYMAVLNPGDKILGMDLSHGGHLTHGAKVNFSGKLYQCIAYGVNKETEQIDMDEIRAIAQKEKPKIIVSGATAYPRLIDFDGFAKIAKEINAYAMADISHIAGLCAVDLHPNPTSNHDIVTTTTHKTLRGPRGGIILSKIEDSLKEIYSPDNPKTLAQKIDSAVMPGIQGGPLEHIIAAKAINFQEALQINFIEYQKQIISNAQALAKTLTSNGLRLVSGGTDNHLILIDCTNLQITGKEGADSLAEVNIYTNFNKIPFDTRPALNPSGIRIGTPSLTTRGMKEPEMVIIGNLIAEILKDINNETKKEQVRKKVKELTDQYSIYTNL